ncbi:MAG: thioesterase family protein [Actinobacteria bacterium]|nr:thioesterase family protein [Actinomycetota bacterium]
MTIPPQPRAVLSDAGLTDRVPGFKFSVCLRVELSDTDAIGVVYFGRWSRYVDLAASAYRDHLALAPLGEPGHAYVIRSFHMDYHASAYLGDEIEVFIRCARLGRTSHEFAVRIERVAPAARHVADATLVVVGVDAHDVDPEATPIPKATRDRIAAFEGSMPTR